MACFQNMYPRPFVLDWASLLDMAYWRIGHKPDSPTCFCKPLKLCMHAFMLQCLRNHRIVSVAAAWARPCVRSVPALFRARGHGGFTAKAAENSAAHVCFGVPEGLLPCTLYGSSVVCLHLLQCACNKVLITAVLLLGFMEDISDCYDVVEYFAGTARVAKSARKAGLKAAALDVLYHPKAFDITSPPGFATLACRLVYIGAKWPAYVERDLRLAILAALRGRYGSMLAMLGVCCSSWVAISRGSSHRSFLNPMGYTGYEAVRLANLMAARTEGSWHNTHAWDSKLIVAVLPARTTLILMVIEALSGVWLVEQPASSLLFQSDRFCWLIAHFEQLNMREPGLYFGSGC